MVRTLALALCLSGVALGNAAGLATPPPSPDAIDAAAADPPVASCDPADAACASPAESSAMPADQDAAPAEKPIDEPFGNAWLGAPDGDVTLVLFVDYACPACRAAQPVVDRLLAADKRVKVVYRILVNEDAGRQAAMTSLAVAQSKGDWGAFHRALDAAGDPTPATIAAALHAAAIDPAGLPSLTDPDMAESPILGELSHNDALIYRRKGTAVPAWLIGDGDALNGFELEKLQAALAKARERSARR
jgi:protein-disulfide isomerase